jgi:hypothetical protein
MSETTTKPLRFETKRAAFDYCAANGVNPLLVAHLGGLTGERYGVGAGWGYYIVNKKIGTFAECAAAGVRRA